MILLAFISVLGLSVGQAQSPEKAPAAPKAYHFLHSEALELAKALPLPPEEGSLAALADVEAVLQAQVWRTPDQIAWAKTVEKWDVFDFSGVLGSWFTAANLPTGAKLFKEAADDLRQVSPAVKRRFARPRPPKVDPAIQPCVELPTSGSYPSGHTLYIFVEAGVLAEVFPDQRDALLAYAHRAAWGRIQGGVHFPTDVVGGRLLAEILVKEMKQSEAFKQAIEACRKEAEPFRLRKAS
jgi:acid phosphatase (class A)